MKKTLTQRVAYIEKAIRRLQKEIDRVDRDMHERTRTANRIGFEVWPYDGHQDSIEDKE